MKCVGGLLCFSGLASVKYIILFNNISVGIFYSFPES